MFNIFSYLNNPHIEKNQEFAKKVIFFANYFSGKMAHLYISFLDKSLEMTADQYLRKTGIQVNIDTNSLDQIEQFRQAGKGIIVLNHTSFCNFGDYLPLFSALGDKILKNTFIYTGTANYQMNTAEFPGYTFRCATPMSQGDGKKILKQLESDIETIHQKGGYIFIVPTGFDTDLDADFKGIFLRMVDKLLPDVPLLANHIDRGFSYNEIIFAILAGKLGMVTLKSMFTSSKDWKGKTGKEMRQYYYSLFDEKKELL